MTKKEQAAAMKEARKIAQSLVITPKQLTFKNGNNKDNKLNALNKMMSDFGVSDRDILKNPTIMAWLKSKTALLLQWYVDKRDEADFEWTMCYEKDLPRLTSNWIKSSGYDFQLTIWNAKGEEVELKVEKVKLVKV